MTEKQALTILIKTAKIRLKRLAANYNAYRLYQVAGLKGEYDEYERITEAINTLLQK